MLYTVLNTDTMTKIAFQHGVSVEDLRRQNNLPEGNPPPGTALIIPGISEGLQARVARLERIVFGR